MGALAYDELTSEYKGRILSPTHPTARQIARVVTRILEANNLGALKSSHSSYPTPLEPFLNPGEELWTADYSSDDRAASRSKDTEWNLIVVDDDKTVNAAAAYGTCVLPLDSVWKNLILV
jgi:metalloendopeptidase OMA1, mitochondrial